MRFYDCDDPGQFGRLGERMDSEDLLTRRLIQTFGPDEPAEARNRGFRPAD